MDLKGDEFEKMRRVLGTRGCCDLMERFKYARRRNTTRGSKLCIPRGVRKRELGKGEKKM